MIKFTKIKYKNFLSSGNYWTEINFLECNSTLIVGQNGAGKSTLLDALTFVLFNKPFRKINKNQLVNTINEKECLVEIDFFVLNDSYKIIRGIKPSRFEIIKNGKVLDQLSSINDQQKYLEQNILKLNYKSFTQIVILGSTNFIPFMQLASSNRREVVEDILDIKIFSSMNDITKVNIKTLREEIREYEYKKQNIKDKIESQNTLISELKKRNSVDIEEKTKSNLILENQIKELLIDTENISKDIDKLTPKVKNDSGISEKIKKAEILIVKLNQKISQVIEDKSFFLENDVCPTCTQKLDENFRDSKVKKLTTKIEELQSGTEELEKTLLVEKDREKYFSDILDSISKLNQKISENNFKLSQLESQRTQIQKEIQKLNDRSIDLNIEYENLDKLKEQLEIVFEDIAKKTEDLMNYEFIHTLLKDNGAKTSIIKKYLPIINKSLNNYLSIMEFPINFNLDDEFNATALNPIYEDFSYDSFSEGEKMRIDLSLLFTWREVAKLKNSINTNLLILDEVFDSSLDEFGTDSFTKIIKYIISNSNVFVISHKVDELEDKFDRVLKFKKDKGFGILVDD